MNDLNGVACHLGDKSIDFVGTEAVVAPAVVVAAPAVVVATPATPVEAYRKLHHRLRFPVPPTLLLLLLLLLPLVRFPSLLVIIAGKLEYELMSLLIGSWWTWLPTLFTLLAHPTPTPLCPFKMTQVD